MLSEKNEWAERKHQQILRPLSLQCKGTRFFYISSRTFKINGGVESRLNPNPNRHCKRKNALPTKNGFNLRKHTAGCRCKRSCCPVDKKRCLLPKRRWKQNKLLVERQMLDSGREIQKGEGKILDAVKTLATMETVTRKQTNQRLKQWE